MKSFAHHYSSDISREQFELIRTDLEGIRKRTKPRKVDLYDIFCALLYTLKMGAFGAIYPVIFLNGKPSIITGYFGLKRHLLLVSLLWIRF